MNNFKAKRVTRSYKQTIYAKPDIVFPLLCPVREEDWLPGWKCQVLYSECGYAEKNGVYATEHAGEEDTIWFINRRDTKNNEIEFLYFVPGIRVTKLNIAVKNEPDGRSGVYITYIHTATSEKGNLALKDQLSPENFKKQMEHWEVAMNNFLLTVSETERK